MSIDQAPSADQKADDCLDNRLDPPRGLIFPEGWRLSDSWQRAQTERDRGITIDDGRERIVWLEEGQPHRVVVVLEGDSLRAECSCDGYRYHRFCAHLASCWWRWVRGRITVPHLDTTRDYQNPPSWLRVTDREHGAEAGSHRPLDALTAAEMDAYLTCDCGDIGVREYARRTDRSAGTVGNLLTRARENING